MDNIKQPATPIDTEKQHPGHETRDADLRLIVISAGVLSAIIIVSLLAVGGLFDLLAGRQASLDRPLPPLADIEQLPPEPRLQASPAQELRALRAAEDEMLHTYGWINQEAGVVRIPIERAMELTLERGLPVRPQN